MSPDRNPDGFDHFRRAYVGGALAKLADSAMPRSQARMFRRFLAGLEAAERPTDPPEPPKVARRRRRPMPAQGRLL